MGEIGVRKITTISFKTKPFSSQRKGQGIICLCSLGKGFACRKSHRFPLTHQPRRERKGQGIELLGESAKRLFFTLLVARSSCNCTDPVVWDGLKLFLFKLITCSQSRDGDSSVMLIAFIDLMSLFRWS